MSDIQNIEQHILEEAIDWWILMSEQDLSIEQQQQFEQWQNQTPQHQQAWQRTLKLQQHLGNIPSDISKKALLPFNNALSHFGKLALVLGLSSVVAITIYYSQQQAWFADYKTPYAKQKTIILKDGTRLMLNSKTAIDINYSAQERQIILYYGEIFIETAKETQTHYRPFKVLSQHGVIQSLGTQFNVEQYHTYTRVAVIEHAVKVMTSLSQQTQQIHANQQIMFNAQHIGQVKNIQPELLMWRKGLIVANRMPLSAFAQQLDKYYGIEMQIPEQYTSLMISGTYPTDDLPRLLKALEQTYGLTFQKNFFGNTLLISKNQNQ